MPDAERHAPVASSGSRVLSLRTTSRTVSASRSISSASVLGPAEQLAGRLLVADGWQVDVDVRGGRARGRDARAGRRPRGPSSRCGCCGPRAPPRTRRSRRTPGRSGTGPRRTHGRTGRSPRADLSLALGVARELHRRDVARVRDGVLVGELEEAVHQLPCRDDRLRVERRVLRRTLAGPATGRRPSPRGPRRGSPRPPRHSPHRGRALRTPAGPRRQRPSGRRSACSVPPADCRDRANARGERVRSTVH